MTAEDRRSGRRRLRLPLLPGWLRLLGVACVLAAIGYFSLFTAPPQSPGRTPFWDKHLHFAAYAGLACSLAYATVHLRDRPVYRGLLAVGGAIAVGVGVELLQGTMVDRYFGWGDLLANALGAALAGLWFVIERQVRYVRTRRYVATVVSE